MTFLSFYYFDFAEFEDDEDNDEDSDFIDDMLEEEGEGDGEIHVCLVLVHSPIVFF